MTDIKVLFCKVAGVTFEGRQAYIAKLRSNDPVRIIPEPENPYDPNALAVYVAHDGAIYHVGFIPRDLAAQIAPHLEGEAVMATIQDITGGFETRDGGTASLGLVIRVEYPA